MAQSPRPLPPKKDVALFLLEREPSVFIYLDPRRPGVVVPRQFAGQPELVLQVGLNMNIAIPDLKVDDEGVTCTLSFNRAPFWCCMPWHSIWALVAEDRKGGMVWPDDIPREVLEQQKGSGASKPAKKQKPRLAAVKQKAPEADDAGSDVTAEEGKDEAGLEDGSDGGVHPAATRPNPLRAVPSTASAPEAVAAEEAVPAEGGKPKRQLPPYLRVIK